jgi:hypothetical protein
MKKAVSRILSSILQSEAVIYLELTSPSASSGLPEYRSYNRGNFDGLRPISLFDLAPSGVYPTL